MSVVRRVFVLGCPRSGTTLVQSLLAAHTDVLAFQESHFFDKGFLPVVPRRYVVRSAASERLRAFLREHGIDAEPDAPAPRNGRRGVSLLAATFVRQLDQEALRRGRSVWVEKTPDHVFRIPLIGRVAPDARFVHVVRSGPDVVLSLHRATRAWGHPRGWARCAAHWLAAVQVACRHAAKPAHLVIGYEALCRAPEAETRRLVEWLGLSWETEILERYAAAACAVVGEGEGWKSANFGRIRARPTRPLSALPVTVRPLVRAGRRAHQELLRLAAEPAARAPSAAFAVSAGAT